MDARRAENVPDEFSNEAYRRAFDGCGVRMQLLASSGCDSDDLTKQFIVVRDELAELCRRAERAAKKSTCSAP